MLDQGPNLRLRCDRKIPQKNNLISGTHSIFEGLILFAFVNLKISFIKYKLNFFSHYK